MNLEKYRQSIQMIKDYAEIDASENVPAKTYYLNLIYRCCRTLEELIEKLELEEYESLIDFVIKAEGTE